MSELAHFGVAPDDLASGRPYLERGERELPWQDRWALALWHSLLRPLWMQLTGTQGQARAVAASARRAEQELSGLSDDELRRRARAARTELRRAGLRPEPVALCFALISEAAARVLGKRHYDTQFQAGWWQLQGSLVEMATGEGKSLAATLPACTAALLGWPVHVVTVNDYLAERDAQTMAPLYAFFGLRCGAIRHGLSRAERHRLYSQDIVYCSNKELTFDYLRDRTALGERASVMHRAVARLAGRPQDLAATVLRGLCFAIVDEADGVFVDEARTPLILSAGQGASTPALAAWALALARTLLEGLHFELERAFMRVRLTTLGRELAEAALRDNDSAAQEGVRQGLQALTQALCALHLYLLDQHYVIAQGKVQIVDESTGRVMPDRAWESGLHQMIETKEGVETSGERITLARITYQRFFGRYLRLAGMTGTAAEVAGEIAQVYRLPMVRVPLHKPSQWRDEGRRCLPGAEDKWQAVVQSVTRHALEQGRPVLVGTRTVQASEALSARLTAQGIAHVVLNARQDHDEAAIVGQAGQAGAVTVATNMAGRGTDIALGDGVAQRGGLHVILTEYHETPRIDRQLFGRAARQGDPGSGEAIVALDDELFTLHAPWLQSVLQSRMRGGQALAPWALALLRAWAQRVAEMRQRGMRMASLRHDRRLANLLAFSGRGE